MYIHFYSQHKEADDDAFTDFMQTADEQLKVEYEKEARQLDEDFLLNQMEADEAENSEGEEEDIYVTKVGEHVGCWLGLNMPIQSLQSIAHFCSVM